MPSLNGIPIGLPDVCPEVVLDKGTEMEVRDDGLEEGPHVLTASMSFRNDRIKGEGHRLNGLRSSSPGRFQLDPGFKEMTDARADFFFGSGCTHPYGSAEQLEF